MQLTNNFSLEELTKSGAALRIGLDNTPSEEQVEALRTLAIHVLQPLRDQVGAIHVDSGYRAPRVNLAVGGAKHSQHMAGQAADIECDELSNYDLAVHIKDNLEFDELILECYTPGVPDSGWVHVSYNEGHNRGNVLTAYREEGKMVYEQGLIA